MSRLRAAQIRELAGRTGARWLVWLVRACANCLSGWGDRPVWRPRATARSASRALGDSLQNAFMNWLDQRPTIEKGTPCERRRAWSMPALPQGGCPAIVSKLRSALLPALSKFLHRSIMTPLLQTRPCQRRLSSATGTPSLSFLHRKPPLRNRLLLAGFLFIVVAPQAPAAGESKLGTLYTAFLGDPAKPIFVAFERDIQVPQRPSGDKMQRLPDGRIVRITTPAKDYFALLAVKDLFIISYSQKPVVTNLESLTLADELNGFDGDEYWTLSLNHPITLGTTIHGPKAVNRLTIVPKADMRSEDHNQPSSGASIKWLAAEGYAVARFGCRYPIMKSPVLRGRTLNMEVKDGERSLISGTILSYSGALPREIEYASMVPGTVTTVELDEQQDTLLVTHKSPGSVGGILSQTTFRVLSVMQPQAEAMPMLTWRSYHRAGGELRTVVSSNRSDYMASISNTNLILGNSVTRPARSENAASGALKQTVIILVLACSTIGALWLLAKNIIKTKV
jgi:hypothetical protein